MNYLDWDVFSDRHCSNLVLGYLVNIYGTVLRICINTQDIISYSLKIVGFERERERERVSDSSMD
jgi:hypothetical protein